MMGFAKLDDEFAGSSLLVQGGLELAGLWAVLLSMKGREGRVYESIPMLARRCGATIETIERLLGILQAPDPHSRTLDHEGRRVVIEREPRFCIVILNHERYMERDDTAAERMRNLRSRRREAIKPNESEAERYVTFAVTGGCYGEQSTSTSICLSKREHGEGGVGGEPPVPFYRPPGPANPLVAGRRVELERECLALVTELAGLTGEDPVEVIAHASGYKGSATTKLNPATMSDDRLAHTVRDLRADRDELLRRGVPGGKTD